MRRIHLLLVEPSASGHRMVLYVRLIGEEAAVRGWRVDLMTTREVLGHPALDAVKAVLPHESLIHVLPNIDKPRGHGRLSLLRHQWAQYRALARGLARLPADAVPTIAYVVSMDNLYQVLALVRTPFGGVRLAGLMMGLGYHRRFMGLGAGSRHDHLAKWLFRRVLRMRTLAAVTIIDEAFHRYVQGTTVREYGKLSYAPDVGLLESVASRDDARRAFQIEEGQFAILTYGSLSPRKGIAQLLAAVVASPDRRAVLLFAGSADAGGQALLQGPDARALIERGQLQWARGFHDADAEARVFAAADAVWIGYVGFYGSSGVLYQAGAAGLPVIAARDGLIGWLTATHGLGVCCDPAERGTVQQAILALLSQPELANQYGSQGKTLAARHTPARFASAVCDAIERAHA